MMYNFILTSFLILIIKMVLIPNMLLCTSRPIERVQSAEPMHRRAWAANRSEDNNNEFLTPASRNRECKLKEKVLGAGSAVEQKIGGALSLLCRSMPRHSTQVPNCANTNLITSAKNSTFPIISIHK